ncbi:hypothetical protein GYB59_14270 [bacterium]|nr:hypothetical protein [bacterium]
MAAFDSGLVIDWLASEQRKGLRKSQAVPLLQLLALIDSVADPLVLENGKRIDIFFFGRSVSCVDGVYVPTPHVVRFINSSQRGIFAPMAYKLLRDMVIETRAEKLFDRSFRSNSHFKRCIKRLNLPLEQVPIKTLRLLPIDSDESRLWRVFNQRTVENVERAVAGLRLRYCRDILSPGSRWHQVVSMTPPRDVIV